MLWCLNWSLMLPYFIVCSEHTVQMSDFHRSCILMFLKPISMASQNHSVCSVSRLQPLLRISVTTLVISAAGETPEQEILCLLDLNIQISQLLKSNKRWEKWRESKEAKGCQQMVKIKLAGYYTSFHFKVQYKISIIRTINYPCKMANVHPCQVECTLMAFPQTENVKI